MEISLNRTKLMLIVCGVMLTLLTLPACNYFHKQSNQATPVQKSPGTQKVEISESILFDASKVQVGDKIGTMTITELSVSEEDAPAFSAHVQFTGEVTLHGTYHYEPKHEFLGHDIRFKVDERFYPLLPKLINDQRYIWFTFDNHEEAVTLLGINEHEESEGEATVAIDNYKINYAPTEIWNTAKLVQVNKK